MAISNPTLLGTATSSGSGTFVEVTGITGFVANSLIFCKAGQNKSGSPTATITDNIGDTGGTSWQLVEAANDPMNAVFAWRILGTGPGSSQWVRCTWSAGGRSKTIAVEQIASGFNTTTPKKQHKTGTAAADTISLTFDATPDSDSLTSGVLAIRRSDGDCAPGSQFTELADFGLGTGPNDAWQHSQYDPTSPTTTYDVSGTGASSNSLVAVAIEIDASGAGPTVKPWHHYRQLRVA